MRLNVINQDTLTSSERTMVATYYTTIQIKKTYQRKIRQYA